MSRAYPGAARGYARGVTNRCANCGEPLQGPFCSACGQENRNLARLSLGQISHDWLGDAFTFDSRLLRTLVPLVRKPGFLTGEYLAGRRVRRVCSSRMPWRGCC